MSLNKNRYHNGFTIIELTVVIVVIGILATISVFVYSGVIERSRNVQARAEIAILADVIEIARTKSGKTLLEITGVSCTRCQSATVYAESIGKIADAANVDMNSILDGDPWGMPYAIDENEGEYPEDICRDNDLVYAISKVTPTDAWNRTYPPGLLKEIPFSLPECT